MLLSSSLQSDGKRHILVLTINIIVHQNQFLQCSYNTHNNVYFSNRNTGKRGHIKYLCFRKSCRRYIAGKKRGTQNIYHDITLIRKRKVYWFDIEYENKLYV